MPLKVVELENNDLYAADGDEDDDSTNEIDGKKHKKMLHLVGELDEDSNGVETGSGGGTGSRGSDENEEEEENGEENDDELSGEEEDEENENKDDVKKKKKKKFKIRPPQIDEEISKERAGFFEDQAELESGSQKFLFYQK